MRILSSLANEHVLSCAKLVITWQFWAITSHTFPFITMQLVCTNVAHTMSGSASPQSDVQLSVAGSLVWSSADHTRELTALALAPVALTVIHGMPCGEKISPVHGVAPNAVRLSATRLTLELDSLTRLLLISTVALSPLAMAGRSTAASPKHCPARATPVQVFSPKHHVGSDGSAACSQLLLAI